MVEQRWRLFVGRVLAVALLLSCSQAADKPAPDGRGGFLVTGALLEQRDAPPYSYLRLRTRAGDVWAAVPTTAQISVKKPVTVVHAAPLKNFDAGDGRRYDLLYFGSLEQR